MGWGTRWSPANRTTRPQARAPSGRAPALGNSEEGRRGPSDSSSRDRGLTARLEVVQHLPVLGLDGRLLPRELRCKALALLLAARFGTRPVRAPAEGLPPGLPLY